MLFTKRNIVIYLIGLSCLSFSHAEGELNCTQSITPFSSCKEYQIYLGQDNDKDSLPDSYFVPKINYIRTETPTKPYNLIQLLISSNVEYYMSTGNMLYTKDTSGDQVGTIGEIDNNLFSRESWAFEYQKPIRAISSFKYINIELPTLTGLTNPFVGFKYNYAFKKATAYDASNTLSQYRRMVIPNMDFTEEMPITYVSDNKRRVRSDTFFESTCSNYKVQWCGDKKLSTHTGYYLDNKFYPVNNRVNTGFTAEICDSTTSTGAACVNGTQGCCNTTCSGFGGGRCGDEIINDGGTDVGHGSTYMSGDVDYAEACDLGVENGGDSCNLDCTTRSDLIADLILDPLEE